MKIRFGFLIKKYREAHNYDQALLGRLAGLSRGKVIYIENDKSTQKEDQLEKLATGLDVTLWCYAKGVEPCITHEFIVVPLCLLHSITTDIIGQILVTEDNFKFLMPQSEIGGRTLVAIHRIGDVQVELRKGIIPFCNFLDGVIGCYIRFHDTALQQHGKRILTAFTDKVQCLVVRADNTGYGVMNFRHVAI